MLPKDISNPLNSCIIVSCVKVSGICDGIPWNLWENTTDVFYINKKLAINVQEFEISEVSDGPYCNSNPKSETETYAANLIYIW